MGLDFRKTKVDSADAAMLMRELNERLVGILGHNGMMHVRLEDFEEDGGFFLVGYDGETPVCCAGLRRVDENTGEVKRVYARKNGSGYGAALMAAVEKLAADMGYKKLILECREGNPHAVNFYIRQGYVICEKYPPYDEEADAVCLEKIMNDEL